MLLISELTLQKSKCKYERIICLLFGIWPEDTNTCNLILHFGIEILYCKNKDWIPRIQLLAYDHFLVLKKSNNLNNISSLPSIWIWCQDIWCWRDDIRMIASIILSFFHNFYNLSKLHFDLKDIQGSLAPFIMNTKYQVFSCLKNFLSNNRNFNAAYNVFQE